MKVSVIIPNYNHAKYLKQRIDSVLNQTYQNFELIILDDRSTDNSVRIINEYKGNPKISHIIFNEQNSGSTFKQWKKGVAFAQGDYIWIAESDDYADKNFLYNAMQHFKNNTELGLYFSNYYPINEMGNIVLSNELYPEAFRTYFDSHPDMSGKHFCEHYLFFYNLILNASAVVFKRSLFNSGDDTYLKLKVSGDWRMWANICYHTRIFFDRQKLNYYRTHTLSVRSIKQSLMGAEAVQNMIYFVRKTTNKVARQRLKEGICKNWVYSFYMNKSIPLNALIIKDILLVDSLFPLRLIKRIAAKFFKRSTA